MKILNSAGYSLLADSFYKALDIDQNVRAHLNEFDFDSPDAVDFDLLVERLGDLKAGHQREVETTPIYSPHVLILEGIFALYDRRILDLLDIKIFADADADVCLARRIVRDVRERSRDIEGCIKQWMSFVKPNFERYVEPQRKVADIIVPRGMENRVAIDMVVGKVRHTLLEKSHRHQDELKRLGQQAEDEPLSPNVLLLKESNQVRGMSTIIQNPMTNEVDFMFYFDRLSTLLVERALENAHFAPLTVQTPQGSLYQGLKPTGEVSAVVILRGGSCLETGLKRVIPECKTGRMLIQSSYHTGEPELHYLYLPKDISAHDCVLLLDAQMSSGGAALMAVRVLVDHGVAEERVVFVTMYAGKMGVVRLLKVFPGVKVVVGDVGEDGVERWVEKRYFGC
ncbi:MAG: hypothetical protein Q9217_003765 [Psora testacea]